MVVIVNPALMAAASVQQKAKDAVLAQLRLKRATGPTRAIPLPDEQGSKALEELIGLAVVRSSGHGRYWLDEAALARSKTAGTRVALIIVAFLLSVTASLLALTLN
jgi:hypothetical protein